MAVTLTLNADGTFVWEPVQPETEAFVPDITPYQFAFAPTDVATTVLVSPPHLDQGQPYGDYRDTYDAGTSAQ